MPDVKKDNGILWDDVPQNLSARQCRKIEKQAREAFLDRRAELWARRGVVLEKTPQKGFIAWLKSLFNKSKQVADTSFFPRILTPIVTCNLAPAFERDMLAIMDAPERAEHIRLGKMRRTIQPLCEYDVLYYSAIPEWVEPHEYDRLSHLFPPDNITEQLNYEGKLISLTRARMIARELTEQKCFGVIVGFQPTGFYYEPFGGRDEFVHKAINPKIYEKSYALARSVDFGPYDTSVGEDASYELQEGRLETDTPTLKLVSASPFPPVGNKTHAPKKTRFSNRK